MRCDTRCDAFSHAHRMTTMRCTYRSRPSPASSSPFSSSASVGVALCSRARAFAHAVADAADVHTMYTYITCRCANIFPVTSTAKNMGHDGLRVNVFRTRERATRVCLIHLQYPCKYVSVLMSVPWRSPPELEFGVRKLSSHTRKNKKNNNHVLQLLLVACGSALYTVGVTQPRKKLQCDTSPTCQHMCTCSRSTRLHTVLAEGVCLRIDTTVSIWLHTCAQTHNLNSVRVLTKGLGVSRIKSLPWPWAKWHIGGALSAWDERRRIANWDVQLRNKLRTIWGL